MKNTFLKVKWFFLFLGCFGVSKMSAEDFSLKIIPNQESQILVESNNQSSDLNNLIFYAEGNVKITSADKEFIAKSNRAIFYKSSGKIKLMGDVEVVTSEFNKLKAAEIIYFLKEKKFEAMSDSNQRVKTTFGFNEKK